MFQGQQHPLEFPATHVYDIELVTMQDVLEFVRIASSVEFPVLLKDGENFCVNGKSLLGAIAAVEWGSLYCESSAEIYEKIKKFVKE